MSNTTPTEIKTLKDRIVSILTESTGIAMMDSGGGLLCAAADMVVVFITSRSD